VLLSGSGGLVGSALTSTLTAAGHTVVPLLRRPPTAGDPGVRWDPAAGTLDIEALRALGPYGGVVHLAGAGIGDRRWSAAYRREIRESRVGPTRFLAGVVADLQPVPAVMVSASAVGYYGDRGAEVLTEDSGPGEGFLADVCRDWEAATARAEAATRVVRLRSGIVLDRRGGALAKQLPIFRLALGARLGSGEQYVSWITLADEVAAIVRALEDARLVGPVNLCSPAPVTNAEFTRALGRALHRPAALTAPRMVVETLLGAEMAGELLFSGQRAVPARLEAVGHSLAHPGLDGALRAVLNPTN
jgi:uncharacterized protein (TIGR01777 family)